MDGIRVLYHFQYIPRTERVSYTHSYCQLPLSQNGVIWRNNIPYCSHCDCEIRNLPESWKKN